MEKIFDNRLIKASLDYDIHFLDIGARSGIADDILALRPAVHAVSFEPEPVEAKRLQETADNRWRSFTVIPMAVGDTDGQAKLYIPQGKEAASLLPHNGNLIEEFGYKNLHGSGATIDVPCCTLNRLMADGRLRKASYIKIDVEGAELALLKEATEILPSTLAMRIEVSFLEHRIGQPLIWEIADWLSEQGFDVVDIVEIHRWRRRNLPASPYRCKFDMPYSKGRLSQGDLVVIRRIDTIFDITTQIEAVLILAALGYFDLAITFIRTQPDIKRYWLERHGFCLEQTLMAESRKMGRWESWLNLRKSLRLLVPALRSTLFGLPFSPPQLPY